MNQRPRLRSETLKLLEGIIWNLNIGNNILNKTSTAQKTIQKLKILCTEKEIVNQTYIEVLAYQSTQLLSRVINIIQDVGK